MIREILESGSGLILHGWKSRQGNLTVGLIYFAWHVLETVLHRKVQGMLSRKGKDQHPGIHTDLVAHNPVGVYWKTEHLLWCPPKACNVHEGSEEEVHLCPCQRSSLYKEGCISPEVKPVIFNY